MLGIVSNLLTHITLSPSYGASSGMYFMTHIKVAHGQTGMRTVGLELSLPQGVASARPEVPSGWTVNVTTYELSLQDQNVSHGETTAPDKITWTATAHTDGISDNNLLYIGLQLKLLCSFNDPVQTDGSGSQSIWQGQHTLWFKIKQHLLSESESKTIDWSAALQDRADGTSPPWNDFNLKPCPYLFIHAGDTCEWNNSSDGMYWMGFYTPPTPNRKPVLHEQHVIDLMTELSIKEEEMVSVGVLKEITKNVLDVENDNALLHQEMHDVEHEIDELRREWRATARIAYVAIVLSSVTIALAFTLQFCKLLVLKIGSQSKTPTNQQAPQIAQVVVDDAL